MLVIAHRGASVAERENSPAAFLRAGEMGADGVELDVRLGPDDRLVVHHDPLPDDPRQLGALPGLAPALDACADLLVNVEIKTDDDGSARGADHTRRLVESVVGELSGRGTPQRWLISSFHEPTVERCRATAPHLATALLVVGVDHDTIERVAAAGHAALHPRVDAVTADLVERCHAAGLAVNTWTCNDGPRIRELAAAGVDGVCTDVPDEALQALGRSAGPDVTRPRAWWGTRA